MALIRLYIGDVKDIFVDYETNLPRPVHSVRIKESQAYSTDYTVIDTQSINPADDFIETNNASDEYLNRWYKIEYISDLNDTTTEVTVFGESEPTFPEQINDIINEVRGYIGDTDIYGEADPPGPAWTDREYLNIIRFALKMWTGEKNLSTIREADVVPITLLVEEYYANLIAYDHGKYIQLQTPSTTLNKSEIMSHYLQIAEGLRDQIATYRKRLNMDSGGYNDEGIISQMPNIKSSKMKRFDKIEGIYVRGNQPRSRRVFFPPTYEGTG
jgi:hypothetical protein